MNENILPEIEIIDQTERIAKTGSWQLNLVTNELYWSKGVYRILEMEPTTEKLDLNKGLEIVHPDDRERTLEKLNQALHQGVEYRIKKRCITATNKIKYIISSGKVFKDEHNNPVKLIGIFQDITEFVETNEKMELLNKITNDVIYDWDIPNDIFNWGESFTRIFGHQLNPETYRINDFIALMHPSDYERLTKEWEGIFKDKSINQWNKEFRLRKSDNFYAYVEETVIIIRDNLGVPVKMIGLLRDVTNKKISSIKKVVQNQISLLFKQNKKSDAILEDILAYLTAYDNFVATELWLLNTSKTNITLQKWATKNETTKKSYQEAFVPSKLAENQGLAGKIWKEKQYKVWKNAEIDNLFNSKKLVQELEINSILGVPLFSKKNKFIGALLLFAKEDLTLDKLKIEPYTALGPYLGDEIKRKNNEERNKLMFESGPDIIAISNAHGYFTKVNKAFCDILGYSAKELTSHPFAYFVHPDDLKKTDVEYFETLSGSRKANNFINRYRTKKGDYKWIAWSSSEVFGDENHAYSYGRDVTEITKLQNLFQETAKLAEIGSWECNTTEENSDFYLSQVVNDIYDLAPNEKLTLNQLLQFIAKTERIKAEEAFNLLIGEGQPFDIEFQIKTKKENTKWIRCIGKPEYDFENKVIKILGSIQNITHQKLNGLDLAQKNIFLSSITNVISELINSNDWYESLSKVFQITGNTIDVDRIYYFEIDDINKKQLTCSQKIEWTKNHIEPQIENPELQHVPIEVFSDFFNPLIKGQLVAAITSQLPEGNLKENVKKQNIQSFLVLPLFINKVFHGFIGFDDCTEERHWTTSELSFLTNIAFNLATTIQRIKTNAALQKSLLEKNDILESIGDAFISLDKDWKITYWNNKTEKITGFTRQKVIGQNIWELFPQIQNSIHEKSYKEALKNQKTLSFQTRFERLNLWVEVSVYPSKTGLAIYYKDITTTKLFEDTLKASNDRFEKSTAATNEAIWDWDLEKNNLYRGEGFTKSFGYKYPNFIYDANVLAIIQSRIKASQAEEVINSLIEAINNPKVENWKKEYWYKKENGEYAFIINNTIIIRNKKGEAVRIVGALQDITSLKKQEDSLRILNKKLENQTKALLNSNQELEQFAYVASHDLQEPLRMVTSFLTHLDKKYAPILDEKGKQYIYFAVDGANRMKNIILDILEYSRIGKSNELNEAINITTIVEEVCKMNSQKMNETHASITYNNLPTITGFKTPLTQIFHNLIGNALKYQKPNQKAEIHIEAFEDKNDWHFTIQDNGIGIDKEFHNKIFIIFQRLHTKQEFSGSGMGLAIVKKIIDNLNGKIWVESAPQQGSKFHFTLPKK